MTAARRDIVAVSVAGCGDAPTGGCETMPEFKFDVTGLPETKFGKGESLLVEGRRGGTVYVLKEGAVRVVTGGREVCKVNTPLATFGEISVLLDSEASASVITEADSTFYVIKDFVSFLRSNPEAGLHVARVLSSRIVNMNNAFVEIKAELGQVSSAEPSAKTQGKIQALILKLDQFWGQELWSLPKK